MALVTTSFLLLLVRHLLLLAWHLLLLHIFTFGIFRLSGVTVPSAWISAPAWAICWILLSCSSRLPMNNFLFVCFSSLFHWLTHSEVAYIIPCSNFKLPRLYGGTSNDAAQGGHSESRKGSEECEEHSFNFYKFLNKSPLFTFSKDGT